MYIVSPEFITALHAEARFERVRGTVGGVSFDDSNVLSLSFSNRCSDTAEISIGYCYVGELQITFTNVNINRGEWRDKEIYLEWGLVLADDSVEYIPVGYFTINEATWSGSGITVKAFDNISKLDKACSVTETDGTVYDLLSLAAYETGLTLGQSQADIEALPNGTERFALYPNSDIKTWRDFVAWVSQLVVGFCYAGRDGKLYVKSYDDLTSVDSFTDEERDIGTTFSDYTTAYDGISVVLIESQITKYFSAGTGGAVINLGSNPFLQYGKDTLITQCQNIAEVVAKISLVPFNSTILSSVVYDLGDVITCTGGLAGSGSLSCCIQFIDWNSKNSTNLQGYGSDPSLTNGKSKTDKALQGLLTKTSENQVIIYSFINAQAISLGNEDEKQIVNIRFATISPKIVNIWHEVKLDLEAIDDTEPIICTARYYLNDDLIAYTPVTSWNNDGFHLLHLLYFLNELESSTPYSWKVTLELSNGTGTIALGDIHASLYGQGLVASGEWDGIIEVSDDFSITLHSKYSNSFQDNTPTLNFPGTNPKAEIIENFSITLGSHYATTFTESVTVDMTRPIMNLTDEDGVQFVTEDGDPLITEGDDE